MLGEPAIKKNGYEEVPQGGEENLEWKKKKNNFRIMQLRLNDHDLIKRFAYRKFFSEV